MRLYNVTIWTKDPQLTIADTIEGLRHEEVTDVLLSAGAKAYKVTAVSQTTVARYERQCHHVLTYLGKRAMKEVGATIPFSAEWVPAGSDDDIEIAA